MKTAAICLTVLLLASITCGSGTAKTFKGSGYLPGTGFLIYIPDGLSLKKRHPAFIGLSPTGNEGKILKAFKKACDKNKIVLVAATELRNGLTFKQNHRCLHNIIKTAVSRCPVDPNKIYIGGLSGGGQVSYWFAQHNPRLVKGVISNCGIINRSEDRSKYPPNNAVLVASKTDFRYKEMKEDFRFLRSHGWRLKWIEFKGGHSWAPPGVLAVAMEELLNLSR